jgi:aarF domain-containing kinase
MRRFPHLLERVDVVALLDEWAARFFEELDYVREGNNGTRFAADMAKDLPQVRAMYGPNMQSAMHLFGFHRD